SPLLATSHNFPPPSLSPRASFLPWGENATDRTFACCLRVNCSCPVATSHNRTVVSPSLPPDANVLPSGEKANEPICPVCPFKFALTCAVATSHSFKLPSPAEAIVLPSGENATAEMDTEVASMRPCSCRVAVSHSFTLRSELPEAKVVPSGENVTELTHPRCP